MNHHALQSDTKGTIYRITSLTWLWLAVIHNLMGREEEHALHNIHRCRKHRIISKQTEGVMESAWFLLSPPHTPTPPPHPPNLSVFSTHLWNEGRYREDAPVSPIENVFAALMLASQNCDCLSVWVVFFFMGRCQMDVSCLMKIICAHPVLLC